MEPTGSFEKLGIYTKLHSVTFQMTAVRRENLKFQSGLYQIHQKEIETEKQNIQIVQ
jgi:ABC-type Na+ transport system ATPase subunit NatA